MRIAALSLVVLAAASAAPLAAQSVAEVQVAPATLTLAPGATQKLRAVAYDGSGAVIVSGTRYRWVSANVNVARVDSTGTVTAVAAGAALVRAEVVGSSPMKSGAATITVRR